MLQKFLSVFLLSYSLIISSFAASTREIGFDIGVLKTLGGTPASPSAGKNKVYVKDGDLKLLDAAGTEKTIGGSGATSSGVNILANASFEEPINTAWTNSGGSFTQESFTYTAKGDLKYARFVATTSGQYFETVATTIPSDFSGGCQADFKKINVSGDDLFKVEVLDSSLNVLTSANVKKSSWVKFPTIGFTCPAPGTQVKLRVTSLAAGTIEANLAYLGSNQNIVNIAQPKLIGTISISGCSTAWISTSTSLTDFPSVSGCTYSTTGQALAPTTNIPAIRFSSLQAGDYVLEYDGQLYSAVANRNAYYQFGDGTNLARENVAHYGGTSTVAVPEISQSISYATSQVNVTLAIKTKIDSGGSSYLYGTNGNPGVIKVWHFPSTQEQAVNTDQASWLIDVNIGGANATLTTIRSSYTEISGSSWDMVVNTNKGSAPAEIPCQSTTASTGLTCSGVDESMGVVFTPPNAGSFEVCVYGAVSLGSSGNGIFQLIETPNNAQTILQEGGTKINIQAASTSFESNISHCSDFVFNSTSKRTIRLMHEKNNTVALIPLTDRDANSGQRDFRFTVKPILSAYNRPILTGDQVKTRGAINPEIFSAAYGGASLNSVCPTSSSCTLYNKIGTGISSVNQATAGAFTLGFDKTFSVVNCTATTIGASTVAPPVNSGTTPPMSCSNCNSMVFVTGNPASSYVSTYGTINCIAVP